MSSRETKRRLMAISYGMFIPERCYAAEYQRGGSLFWKRSSNLSLKQSVDLPLEAVYERLDPEVVEWLKTNVQIQRADYRYISFLTQDDLFAFKLRWG